MSSYLKNLIGHIIFYTFLQIVYGYMLTPAAERGEMELYPVLFSNIIVIIIASIYYFIQSLRGKAPAKFILALIKTYRFFILLTGMVMAYFLVTYLGKTGKLP